MLFYANGNKEKNGIVPIMGRVTNGTVAQSSCKRSIAKNLWDAKGKSVEARETNLALDNIKAQIIKHYPSNCRNGRCSGSRRNTNASLWELQAKHHREMSDKEMGLKVDLPSSR